MSNKFLFLLFLLFLFSGADRISFSLASIHIRFVQIMVIFILFYFYYKTKLFTISINNLLLYIIFILSSIISLSYDINMKSIAFELYLVFNYIFIYWLTINISKQFKLSNVLKYYLLSMKIISIYTILQFILGQMGIADPLFAKYYQWGITRPAVWFYEPSYLAISLIIYFSMSYYLFMNIKYIDKSFKIKQHLLISTLAVISSTSSTAYVGLLLSLLIITFLSKKVKLIKKLILILFITFFLSIIFIAINNLSNGFIEYQLVRLNVTSLQQLNGVSGGRVEGWFTLINAIKENPLFGIGGGNYFIMNGVVATNVTLELITELGLIGFTIFIILFNYPIIYYLLNKKRFSQEAKIYINSLLFSLFISLIIWQANQNYMRIYMWVHYALIYSFIFYAKQGKKYEYIN